MENHELPAGSVLINKYSHSEIQVIGFDADKNRYEAIRLADEQELSVGINWWNSYDLKRQPA